MIRVGIVGIGMMGLTHLDVYRRRNDVSVVALCDNDADRLSGKVQANGNIDGQAEGGIAGLDVKRYEKVDQLIADPEVDLVDICLPTDLHVAYGIKALQAGKHLVVEKPLGRTSQEALLLVEAAKNSKGFAFVGHCMRFWPGWTWLKTVIDEKVYGGVLAASFRRVGGHPGGEFYHNGARCGGAAFDLHIHDTDFVQFCFGSPKSVTSFGYSQITDEPDHIVTRYQYDDVPLVVAEGAWSMSDGFRFSMSYTVNFEKATAVFDSSAEQALVVYQDDREPEPVKLDPRMGYDLEVEYFLHCIATCTRPTVVTLEDALESIKTVEAEVTSLNEARQVYL